MFYKGEAVRCENFGLGMVTATGENPQVRFLHDRECTVQGTTLRVVPHHWLYAEIENRMTWEDYLDWRIYKIRRARSKALCPPPFDLAKAMMQSSVETPLVPQRAYSGLVDRNMDGA